MQERYAQKNSLELQYPTIPNLYAIGNYGGVCKIHFSISSELTQFDPDTIIHSTQSCKPIVSIGM